MIRKTTAHTYGIALALVVLSLTISSFKVYELGFPLMPKPEESIWLIEAALSFDGQKSGAIVDFDLPDQWQNFVMLDEYFVAPDYGLNIEEKNSDRRAQWSTRRARGKQTLYYRVELLPTSQMTPLTAASNADEKPLPPPIPDYQQPLLSAINELLADVREDSADVFTFVSQLIVKLRASSNDSNIAIIKSNFPAHSAQSIERLIYVLKGARINARMISGVLIDDGASYASPTLWLEVFNGQRWEGFNPVTGDKGYPENFFLWSKGVEPIFRVTNGRNPNLVFSVSSYVRPMESLVRDRARVFNNWIGQLQLFDLPLSAQNLYRILLMLPIGALVVALMRTVIGLPTLGTFMPVLIALAFRETQLLWGIFLFFMVTSAGLLLRFYLSRLQLLLVPRLTAILTLVILLMLGISLFSAQFGFDSGLSIALFPIVILTMVIERLSIVWEESGATATAKEALGSLIVAIVGYCVMVNEQLSHIMFMFPETLLIVLALSLMLGRYTGYRASELIRFKHMAAPGKV